MSAVLPAVQWRGSYSACCSVCVVCVMDTHCNRLAVRLGHDTSAALEHLRNVTALHECQQLYRMTGEAAAS